MCAVRKIEERKKGGKKSSQSIYIQQQQHCTICFRCQKSKQTKAHFRTTSSVFLPVCLQRGEPAQYSVRFVPSCDSSSCSSSSPHMRLSIIMCHSRSKHGPELGLHLPSRFLPLVSTTTTPPRHTTINLHNVRQMTAPYHACIQSSMRFPMCVNSNPHQATSLNHGPRT